MTTPPTPEITEPMETLTGLERLTEAELLNHLADHLVLRAYIGEQIALQEVEVERRLRAKKATTVDHPRYDKIALEADYGYDQLALAPLKGLLTPERLKEVYAPAREETVVVKRPESWNINRIRGLLKLGGEVRSVIENARRLKSERLVAKLKKEVPHAVPTQAS